MLVNPTIRASYTPFATTVEARLPLYEARMHMRAQKIRQLPVVSDGKLIGAISDRDIWLVLGPEFDFPDEADLIVEDVYKADPYIIDIDSDFEDVLREMADRRLDYALVLQQRELVGIFTAHDACRNFAEFIHSHKELLEMSA